MLNESSLVFNPLNEGIGRWLGPLESEIMSYLWVERGSMPTSIQQVLDHLLESGRQNSYTTISTVLTRLFEKELVTRSWRGRKWVYIPAISRHTFVDTRVSLILSSLQSEGDIP